MARSAGVGGRLWMEGGAFEGVEEREAEEGDHAFHGRDGGGLSLIIGDDFLMD